MSAAQRLLLHGQQKRSMVDKKVITVASDALQFYRGVDMDRPGFDAAWAAFQVVNVPVNEVGKIIGGNVRRNIDAGIFENACPIRLSYALNAAGSPVTRRGDYATVSGADGRWYIYRVNDIKRYLEYSFGPADKSVRTPRTESFSGLKGIVVVQGRGWSNAGGMRRCGTGCDARIRVTF